VNPTIEPNTSDTPAPPKNAWTGARWTAPTSPDNIPQSTANAAGKTLHCRAIIGDRKVRTNVGVNRAAGHANESKHHQNSTPHGSTRPLPRAKFLGRPKGPIHQAQQQPARRALLVSCPRRSQSTNTIHSERSPPSSAVIPEGTVRSARHTPPFPTPNSSKPVMKELRQMCRRRTHSGFPAQDRIQNRPVSSGENPLIRAAEPTRPPHAIARYVEPHHHTTNPNATMTNVAVLPLVGALTGGDGTGITFEYGGPTWVDPKEHKPRRATAPRPAHIGFAIL